MSKLQTWIGSIRTRVAGAVARVLGHLDARAEKDKQDWGSRMEYKRRYTNPDEAKRHRNPPKSP